VLEGLSGAASCVYLAGGHPVVLRPGDRDGIERKFVNGEVDGLLLTGGGDVDPRLYRERPLKSTYGVSEDRDASEIAAVRWARWNRLPVMGICRGAQLINVEAGGTLWQHLPDHLRGRPVPPGAKRADDHRHGLYWVRTAPRSLARASFGQTGAVVMHLHHQAVRRVGHGLRACAWHGDGTIEGVESTDGFWRLGVQFHPEMAYNDSAEMGTFRALVVQAAAGAGMPVPPLRTARARGGAKKRPPRYVRSAWRVEDAPAVIDLGASVSGKSARDSAASFSAAAGGEVTSIVDPELPGRAFCFRCQVEFDDRRDYVDHMSVLHEVPLVDLDGTMPAAVLGVDDDDEDEGARAALEEIDEDVRAREKELEDEAETDYYHAVENGVDEETATSEYDAAVAAAHGNARRDERADERWLEAGKRAGAAGLGRSTADLVADRLSELDRGDRVDRASAQLGQALGDRAPVANRLAAPPVVDLQRWRGGPVADTFVVAPNGVTHKADKIAGEVPDDETTAG